MSDTKNVVCDACGKTHLKYRFHLRPNLDLCLECAEQVKDGTLKVAYMKKFLQATRNLMTYKAEKSSEDQTENSEDDDDDFTPNSPMEK